MQYSKYLGRAILPFTIGSMFLVSGCLATRDWVQTWVPEQLFPIEKRVSDNEAGLTKVNGRVTDVDTRVDTMAKQIVDLETRLGQTNAKADLALESLQRLKPERKMVLHFTDGAYFPSNSVQFSGQAKKDVDSFLSDLKGQSDDGSNLMFVVSGYTDSAGSPGYNYDLSKRRADSIAAYLVAEKNIDPTRVMAVGYGERSPVGDNQTEAGRAKNRRVEILVYRETIAVGGAATGTTAKPR